MAAGCTFGTGHGRNYIAAGPGHRDNLERVLSWKQPHGLPYKDESSPEKAGQYPSASKVVFPVGGAG